MIIEFYIGKNFIKTKSFIHIYLMLYSLNGKLFLLYNDDFQTLRLFDWQWMHECVVCEYLIVEVVFD